MSAEKSYGQLSTFASQFGSTCISVLKVILRSKFNIRLPKADSETCIILGNGPSLKTSLSLYKNALGKHSLICVNAFATADEYTALKPHFYVILDNGFWVSDAKVIIDTLEAIKTKTTWPLKLYIPAIAAGDQRFTAIAKANPHVEICPYNYTVFKGFTGISHWFFNKNLGMPQSQNVLVASIFLAINTGFKNIYIVGADHTWHEHLHVDDDNRLCIKDLHFYDNDTQKIVYTPFKKGLHLSETFKVHEIFATWAKTFLGYIILEKYAVFKKCKVYNASEITFIDAFERKKINE